MDRTTGTHADAAAEFFPAAMIENTMRLHAHHDMEHGRVKKHLRPSRD